MPRVKKLQLDLQPPTPAGVFSSPGEAQLGIITVYRCLLAILHAYIVHAPSTHTEITARTSE